MSYLILQALKEQGRTQIWLAAQIGITYQSLHGKLKNGTFTVSEKYYIANLLKIGANNEF